MSSGSDASTTTRVDEPKLRRLCAEYGVGTTFSGWDGLPHEVDPQTLITVLAALGVDAATDDFIDGALAEAELKPWRRTLPAAVVSVAGASTLVPVHVPHGSPARLWIVTEDGQERSTSQRDFWVEPRMVDGSLTGRATFELPQDLPLGWHTLHAEANGVPAQTTLIVVPDRLRTAQSLEQKRG